MVTQKLQTMLVEKLDTREFREEGVALVKKYELIKPDYLNLFADWLGIDLPSLEMVINKSRNPKFWIETDLNKFEFKGLSDHFKNETKK